MTLEPIRMLPAYRHGAQTPWGGNALRRLYQLDIPDDQTGEALVVSAVPGLNSTDGNGRTLQQLIDLYGTSLVGTSVRGEFPLLLKLLDARDTLSVQVHPDDAYAAQNEHKQGKTEAWVVLHAEKNAELVYGVREGVHKKALREASLQGGAVEALLRRVPVKAGDVLYIPAGMVHAIGAGVVLYEIQQSSDVTYRFYDWERTDSAGNKRELHLDKALDVCDVSMRLDPAVPQVIETSDEYTRYLMLQNEHFTLERLDARTRAAFRGDRRRFMLMTLLAPFTLSCCGEETPLRAGETLLIPADVQRFSMVGTGSLLLASPTV